MKSFFAEKGGGINGLQMREHSKPQPGPFEVLVRVRANSLNFRELAILRGFYSLPIKSDLVMVSDGAGEVVEVGRGVTRVKVGDRVTANVFPRWIDGPFSWEYSAQLGGSMDGMLTEFAVLHEESLVHIAGHLSFEEAATLPCAAVTAWNALTGAAPLLAGQSVLVLGSGGVSLFALQFAKLFGARVIATTSSDEKAPRLKALGADEVVNYRTTTDWNAAVRDLTGGKGVDLVVEVGGAGTLERSLKSVAASGQISMVGWLASEVPTINVGAIIGNVASMRRVAIGSRAQFQRMMDAIAFHRLKPVIDRRFAFEDAVKAFEYYDAGKYFGKIVIGQD